MKPGQYRLSDLLADKLSAEERKPFERVLCDVDEEYHWFVSNYSKNSNGYPRFRDKVTGRMVVIQRAIWEAVHKKFIPPGQFVKRFCHHKDCIKPSHLGLKDRNLESGWLTECLMFEIEAKKQKKRVYK